MNKRTLIILAVVDAAVVLVALLIWTAGRSERVSIDLNSGRRRVETLLLGRRVADRVEETSLSRLHAEYFGTPDEPEWGAVGQGRPGNPEPAPGGYAGAFKAASSLAACLQDEVFTDPARARAAEGFLEMLRRERDVYMAQEFAFLVKVTLDRNEGETIDVKDLPRPPGKGWEP